MVLISKMEDGKYCGRDWIQTGNWSQVQYKPSNPGDLAIFEDISLFVNPDFFAKEANCTNVPCCLLECAFSVAMKKLLTSFSFFLSIESIESCAKISCDTIIVFIHFMNLSKLCEKGLDGIDEFVGE